MSQNSPIESGIQSSKTPGLKPALAAALASLEVQLDQELARYRRLRLASKTGYQTRTESYTSNQPQETTEMTALTGRSQLPATEIKTSIQPAPVPEPPPERPATVTAKIEEEKKPSQPSSVDSNQKQIPLPSPNSHSSIVPVAVDAAQSENLMSANETSPQPDNYLESSEALLRSLTDEQQQTPPPRNSSDSLLSPLGIGSMLLLLMASLTLGYVVFNPKSLPQLSFDKIFNSNSASSNDKTQTQEPESLPQPSIQTELTPIPKYPNLAAKEFPELKDPNDIVGLQPKIPATTIAPVNPPVVIPTPTTPAVTNPLPELQPVQPLNIPPVATEQPSVVATLTPSPANAQIEPGADGFYHIVMDNEGDRSLVTARQIVPDAYLSPNKKFIYLGALKTKEQVQQRLQQLQSQ
jgi:hypothetical protein